VADTPAVGGDYAYERGLTAFDIPQNLTASVGYELPYHHGIFGGWQLQGIMVLRTGRPFTPTISRDVANTGIGGQRPNRLGSGQLSNPTIQQWFDKTAFAAPANFTWGNSGADILRDLMESGAHPPSMLRVVRSGVPLLPPLYSTDDRPDPPAPGPGRVPAEPDPCMPKLI